MRGIKITLLLFVLESNFCSIYADLNQWPGFRGNGNSRTDIKKLPENWNERKGILWKVNLSGFGQSSPVIWNKNVYVTSTGGKNKEFLYLDSYDLNSGKKN